MGILHLVSSKGFFGAENVIFALAKAQKKQGADVWIGIFRDRREPHVELVDASRRYSVPTVVFDCNGRFDPKAVMRIRDFIRKNRLKIIHSHGYKSNFYALFAAVFRDTVKVATCHNWLGNSAKMKFYAFLDKFILNRFDSIIAVSDRIRDEIIHHGIPEEKVRLIDNGVDVERFGFTDTSLQLEIGRNSLRNELGIKGNESIVGTVGRLSPEKGHIYLIKAAKKIIFELSDTKFLIVGDGPLKEKLESEAKNLGLGSSVIFTGIRNDIPKIMNLMDVFVLPSVEEGMPVALLEAMLSKIPVVATRVGAVERIVDSGRTGLLVGPEDTDKLSDAILYLLNNKAEARSMALDGYGNVFRRFSSGGMAKKYYAVYGSLNL
jgi:glycosyltransferase involved in cell wall biosynthesis